MFYSQVEPVLIIKNFDLVPNAIVLPKYNLFRNTAVVQDLIGHFFSVFNLFVISPLYTINL